MALTDYLSKDDYKYHIRTYRLDQILEAGDEDPDAILDAAELDALGKLNLNLSNYYDMDFEFSQSGDSRNSIVLRWAKTLVMYFIYERIPDEMVPERVIKNYDKTCEELEAINGEEKNVPGLKLKTVVDSSGDATPVTRRRIGSAPRRSNDGSGSILNINKH